MIFTLLECKILPTHSNADSECHVGLNKTKHINMTVLEFLSVKFNVPQKCYNFSQTLIL